MLKKCQNAYRFTFVGFSSLIYFSNVTVKRLVKVNVSFDKKGHRSDPCGTPLKGFLSDGNCLAFTSYVYARFRHRRKPNGGWQRNYLISVIVKSMEGIF